MTKVAAIAGLILASVCASALAAEKQSYSEISKLPTIIQHVHPALRRPVVEPEVKSYLYHQSGFDMNVRAEDKLLSKSFHNGRWYVATPNNKDYQLVFTSPSSERFMAVCSVDGLNIVTGKPASVRDTGYIIDHGSITIPGFWLGNGQYAKFHFAQPGKSYASKTGAPNNIGVIAVKFFEEYKPAPAKPTPRPKQADSLNNNLSGTAKQSRVSGNLLAKPAFVSGTTNVLKHDLGTEFGDRVEIGNSETGPFLRGQEASSLTIEYASQQKIKELLKTPLHKSTPFPLDQMPGCKPPLGWKG
jgi:hypothetical protein